MSTVRWGRRATGVAVAAVLAAGCTSASRTTVVGSSTVASTDGVTTTAVAPTGEPIVASERVTVGELVVEVQQRADGRYHACITEAAHIALPERPLCVGPHHDGSAGPRHSWSSADRVGSDVLVLAIGGRTDRLADDRFVTVASATFPVAVAGGVLQGFTGSVVCSVYESDGVRVRYDTGVSTATPGEVVEVPDGGCGSDPPEPTQSSGGTTAGLVPATVLVPVVLRSSGAGAADVEVARARQVVASVAGYFGRWGRSFGTAPIQVLEMPARARLLVDLPEAAAPCQAVGADLEAARPLVPAVSSLVVEVVFGGHLSSTTALRQLYGLSCGGRSSHCVATAGEPAMVLVDALKADEIALDVVVAHELGHVFGLRHPFEADCGGADAPEAAHNLMAIERDRGAVADLRSLELSSLVLTPDQVATVRG